MKDILILKLARTSVSRLLIVDHECSKGTHRHGFSISEPSLCELVKVNHGRLDKLDIIRQRRVNIFANVAEWLRRQAQALLSCLESDVILVGQPS